MPSLQVANMFIKIFKWRDNKQQKKLEEQVSWISQPYISIIENIISWRTPSLSLTVMAATNLVFFVYVHLQIRLLGLLFGLAVIAVVLGGISSPATVSVVCRVQKDNEGLKRFNLAMRRAQQWLGYQVMQLEELREQNRDKFCLVMCLMLGGLVVLGGILSDATLVYLAIQGSLLLPIVLPYLRQAICSIKNNTDSDGDMESFMPELSAQALAELEQADSPMESYSQEQMIEKWIPTECMPGEDSDSNSEEISVLDSGSTMGPGTPRAPDQLTDSSGSSDDEFTPHSIPSHNEDQQMLLKSSVKIVRPAAVDTWSMGGLANLSGLSNLPNLGNLSNLGATIGAWWPGPALPGPSHATHKLLRSDSDDFEIIDEDDLKTH